MLFFLKKYVGGYLKNTLPTKATVNKKLFQYKI